MQQSNAWKDFASKLKYFPVIVKSLEKIHDTTWDMEKNIHDHYEMVYIKRGNAVFNISGEDVLLSPNNIVIIKPHQWHKFNVKSKACEFIVISFLFNTLESEEEPRSSEGATSSLENFINSIKNMEDSSYVTLRLGPKNEIVGTMRRILRERDKGEIWSEFLIYILVTELFVLISRTMKQEYEQSSKYRSMNLKESLYIAKEYMDHNYNRDIVLGDVARYIYLSESYFAHSFKDEFHISPKNYILKKRIETAKEILVTTDMKISDVAISVGFSSQQRFNDIFRKTEGTTPLKYRKQWKEKMMNKIV